MGRGGVTVVVIKVKGLSFWSSGFSGRCRDGLRFNISNGYGKGNGVCGKVRGGIWWRGVGS